MGGHAAEIGTLVLGAALVGVGTWPILDPRHRDRYSRGGMWSYGSIATMGLAVLGFGLVIAGAAVLAGSSSIARVMTWVGMGLALLGGAVFALNPKVRTRN